MKTLIDSLRGKRTYVVGITILVLCFGVWQGWWKIPQEVYTALLGAGLVFLRMAMSNSAGAQTEGKDSTDKTAYSPQTAPGGWQPPGNGTASTSVNSTTVDKN